MQKSLIYVDSITKSQIDATGAFITKVSDMPEIERGQWSILCFQFYDRTEDEFGTITLTPTNLNGKSFRLTADNDFTDTNALMFRSDQSSIPFDPTNPDSSAINIAGDWIDGTSADTAKGQVSVRINTNTAKFREVFGNAEINKTETVRNCFLNLKTYVSEASGYSTIAWLKFVAKNTVSADDGADVIAPTDTEARDIIDALFARSMEYQYSADGINWHDEQNLMTDIYFRTRIEGGGWSDGQLITEPTKTSDITYTIEVSDGTDTVYVTKSEFGIDDASTPEFDVIGPDGYNVTSADYISRRWITGTEENDTYEVTFGEGAPTGTYTLKFTGVNSSIDKESTELIESIATEAAETKANEIVDTAVDTHNNSEDAHNNRLLPTDPFMDTGGRLVGGAGSTPTWVYGEGAITIDSSNSAINVEPDMLYVMQSPSYEIIELQPGADGMLYSFNFGVMIIRPSSLAFTAFSDGVWWSDGGSPPHYASSNTPPDISETNRAYMFRFHWDAVGGRMLANLAYTEDV